MGISVKVLQYLPQRFDFLLGWTFFPPRPQKKGKVLKKGQFQHDATYNVPRGRFEACRCMLRGLFQTHWSIYFTRALIA